MSEQQESLLPQSWLYQKKILEQEFKQALGSGYSKPINITQFNHIAITLALNTVVYDQSYQGKNLDFIFIDDSVPSPFPVGCLQLQPSISPPKNLSLVRLGLMSCRHPELDYIVDLYVTKNRTINQEASMADQEEASFRHTLEILDDPVLSNGAIIELYHTGLEPMVIGCYRAITHILRERATRGFTRNLHFYPRFYDSPKTKDIDANNQKINRDSHGSKIKNYLFSKPWN